MNLEDVPAQATMVPGRHDEAAWRLHGLGLVLARMFWIAIFTLTLVVFCGNLMVGNYGLLTTILLVANTSVWFAVGLVLFWRKSTDRAILLISLLLVLTPLFFIPRLPGALWNYGAWWVPIDFLALLAGVMLIFLYTFPDGRFVPGFTRWLALGWIAVSNLPIPLFGMFTPWNWWLWWLSPLYALVRIAFYCSLALALLYRYQRMSTPIQRQQIKWVVFASTIFIGWVMVVEFIVFLVPSYFPALGLIWQLYQHVNVITPLLAVLFPLSIGFALLRYRLYDIDVIINRTLVYGSLTGILALLYFGFIFALQSLFQGMFKQNNAVAIVVSTLVIAALFQPLRRRIQAIIDRRFYRRKYDAAKTLEAFSATLRNEVELTQLREHLVAVVQETMQPAHVSLWLRPSEHDGKHQAPWRANPPVDSQEG
jgi:hypothetical protein